MQRIEGAFVAVNRWLVGGMMTVMFVLVFTNVVTRYGFGFSINWAEEVSRFLMIWVTFLGAGLALREGRHVAIEVFQHLLGDPGSRWLRRAIAVGLILFFGLLIALGVEFAAFGWNKETMVTQIPRGIPYLAIPIGMAFMVVHFLFIFRNFVDASWEDLSGAAAVADAMDDGPKDPAGGR